MPEPQAAQPGGWHAAVVPACRSVFMVSHDAQGRARIADLAPGRVVSQRPAPRLLAHATEQLGEKPLYWPASMPSAPRLLNPKPASPCGAT